MGCTCSKTGPERHGKPLPTLLSSNLLHLKFSDAQKSHSTEQTVGVDTLSSTCDLGLEEESIDSSSSNWEAQVLQVGSDLKNKLKDPHFVAKCCDLDGSGDLDMHELGHAARVFGMKFSPEQLQQLTAGQKRITKERFAEIVTVTGIANAQTTRPTVPHSLRGIALGQLQHLEALFVQSGWLSEQCDAYNAEHAAAIRQGREGFFHQAANLYAMDAYVVSPMSKPGDCAARKQDHAGTIPPATDKMSFSSLLNPHGLMVHCFVSHFWGKLFSETVAALGLWAQQFQHEHIAIIASPKAVVFWICLFAVNQHAVVDEVGDSPMQGPFNAAIAKAKSGAVMVLDEHINPFKRIWCLFEVSRLKELNQPFELICDLGSLSRPESLEASLKANPAAVERILKATCEALWTVSAINAKASVKKDKVNIWQEIANPGSRKVIRGMHTFLLGSNELPDECQFWLTDFDRYIQSLLSTALLQFFLAHRQFKAAARCCAHGACFTQGQFHQIHAQLTREEELPWLSQLLNVNARDERLDTILFLLRLGDEALMTCNGNTALMYAATGGQHAVARVLLEHGAAAQAADSGGTTALMRAALGGHLAVAQLLLDYGANVAAAENDGTTALMHSALAGHEAMVKLLLEHGADVERAEKDGTTALMGAALGGHTAVAKLLLENRANVLAAEDDGRTALMRASLDGHTAVTQLLLQHRADVAATTSSGKTALSFAVEGGHDEAATLLLRHGVELQSSDTRHSHVSCCTLWS